MPGQPQLNSNLFIGIDATALDVIDPSGGPSNLIVQNSSQTFNVQARFELGGLFAPWLVGLALPYTVTYYYESLGGGPEGVLATTSANTIAGQLVYQPETLATIPVGTLPAGTYNLTTVVSFGGAPPLTAFSTGPVIESF